ncbi:MAG: AI-2E family transporter [Methanothrix sp.]|nr:AI-2E family transporter [Methanothrix sp.]
MKSPMPLEMPYRLGKKNWLMFFTLALAILLSYYIWPLLDGLILGLVFSYVGRPVRDIFKQNRRIGSISAIVCIVVPLSAIFATGVIEASNQIRWLERHQDEIVNLIFESVSRIHIPPVILDEISRSMANLTGMGLNLLAGLPVFQLGSTITLGIINLLISLCVCYFLLLDGDLLAGAAMEFFDLEKKSLEMRCLARIDSILCGVYMGSIYTAIAGGITSVAIFYLFAVPRPFAMASIVFLAGLVPFLTWMVFIPTAVGRYIELGPLDAWLFFIVASILVHIAELVIRPYIVYTKSSLHPLLVLLAFLGGGLVAGIAGFFLAPAVVGVVTGIYRVMTEERGGQDKTVADKAEQNIG